MPSRDLFNTPSFLEMLPDVDGLAGLDLGCGEGNNTRLLAARGAHMSAFDFATAFMSLMDMPEPDAALREACRVLRPGGFLQFSIRHPCFDTPYRRLLRYGKGEAYAVGVGCSPRRRRPPGRACGNSRCMGGECGGGKRPPA
jgi:hypothetical protein